jgi:hypothetical protein
MLTRCRPHVYRLARPSVPAIERRRTMSKVLIAIALAVAATFMAATTAAAVPTRDTDVRSESFLDDGTCRFPIAVTVERTRTTTTFENGDQQRHVQLLVTSTAHGNTWSDRDAYVVFIDADAPTRWTIVGAFTHTVVAGTGTIFLQAGRILYDLTTDTITDLHPGPHGTGSDPDAYAAAVCAALAQ